MSIIDSHGAAHDTSTGRYTSRGYRDADGSLLTPVKHPALTVIEDLILDQHPTAAVAYLADSAPGTGTQNNRLDMILDADGNILWDYMTLDNNRSVAKKNSDGTTRRTAGPGPSPSPRVRCRPRSRSTRSTSTRTTSTSSPSTVTGPRRRSCSGFSAR